MECTHPVLRRVKGTREYVQTPCGICANCRKNFAHMWGTRIYHESRMYPVSTFLTLTYSNENLPIGTYGIPTLVKDDVQKFMKRLRQWLYPQKVRFFCGAEYGDTTKRPHYHLALFGVSPQDDRIFDHFEKQDDGYLCRCKAWNLGLSHVGEVDIGSANYIGGYCLKKVMGKGAKQYYEDKGILAPFSLMSRRPGIGFDYMEKYADEFIKHGNCLVNSQATGLPRYYKEKLNFKDTDFYHDFMDKRQEYLEKVYSEMWMSSTDLQKSIKDHLEQQRQAEENSKFYERIVKNAKI